MKFFTLLIQINYNLFNIYQLLHMHLRFRIMGAMRAYYI